MDHLATDVVRQRTFMAFLWMKILDIPFWSIFNLLPFILYKDLHATPLQITLTIILKPAVSLISLYWSSLIEKRKDRLVSNLIWARVLSHIPFFFLPFVDNPWFYIAAFGFYMMLARGTVPAWMEILKLNIPGVSREKIYAYGSAFGYFGGAVLPLAFGSLMDHYLDAWRIIFPIAAAISLTAIFFKMRIPISYQEVIVDPNETTLLWKKQLLKPWKSAWKLIARRYDFACYQIAFTIGGAGLAIMQPVLPVFFMDKLHLSYTELALAIALCKGIGFAVTSSAWARLMHRINIYRFNGWINILAGVFPLCLIAAQVNLFWLYGGYMLYGIMQAGNEMSWSLSGPIFAKEEDSSVYTNVNILTVGLRGCFVPAIGWMLEYLMPSTGIMLIGSVFCFISALFMYSYGKKWNLEAIASRENK